MNGYMEAVNSAEGIKLALSVMAMTASLGVNASDLEPARPDESSVPPQQLAPEATSGADSGESVGERARSPVDRAAMLTAVSDRLAAALEFRLEQSVESLKGVGALSGAQ